MAAGLGFKDFVTGEVLTAADVDGYLMQGIWVFANAAARTAAVTSPQEGNYSYLKDTNSTEYYTGSACVAAGGGGGGKVLQVVSATYGTETDNSTTTLADTGLSASITPSASSSKVLALVTMPIRTTAENNGNGVNLNLTRASTSIYNTLPNFYNGSNTSFAAGFQGNISFNYLDSPSTTSVTTYKVRFSNVVTANRARVFEGNAIGTLILLEIGA